MASISLTDKDNGRSIDCKVGDDILVSLPTNPSTGFVWKASDTTAGSLQSVQHDWVDSEPNAKKGSPTNVHFSFRVKTAGYIQMNYARPSEGSSSKWWMVTIGSVKKMTNRELAEESRKALEEFKRLPSELQFKRLMKGQPMCVFYIRRKLIFWEVRASWGNGVRGVDLFVERRLLRRRAQRVVNNLSEFFRMTDVLGPKKA